MSEYSFTPVKFQGLKQTCPSPVAASVHKSSPTRLTLRISADLAKKSKLQAGHLLTPFVDLPARALLFIEGQRPIPDTARRIHATTGNALVIEFPRNGPLAELFPGITAAIPLELREAAQGRIVVTVPKPKP
jgi:hypothetical protein